MNPAAPVLFAVAQELAALVQAECPKLRKEEYVVREWFDSGTYNRESALGDEKFLYQFDFRQRKSRFSALGGKTND